MLSCIQRQSCFGKAGRRHSTGLLVGEEDGVDGAGDHELRPVERREPRARRESGGGNPPVPPAREVVYRITAFLEAE